MELLHLRIWPLGAGPRSGVMSNSRVVTGAFYIKRAYGGTAKTLCTPLKLLTAELNVTTMRLLDVCVRGPLLFEGVGTQQTSGETTQSVFE